MSFSLYIHIPWCRNKCLYCDFNSYATRATPWEAYLEALLNELSAHRHHPFWRRPLDTLFFGGGTPSLFPPSFYEKLLPAVFDAFPPSPSLELTLECNPGTVTRERLRGYHALGINRLSFGVQSLNPAHLKTLTRIHSPEDARSAVELAWEEGFTNVSIDLMFGVPGQDEAGWEDELLRALQWPLTHLSVYNLTPEEGTALIKALERGQLHLPDEETLVRMYQRTRTLLRAHGFEPYEISNFSKQRPCQHNLQYWRGGDYLGLGAGAHSFCQAGILPGLPEEGQPGYRPSPLGVPSEPTGGTRWWVIKDPAQYQNTCKTGRLPLETHEVLSPREALSELLLTRGRLMEGLPLDELRQRAGQRPVQALLERAQPFLRRQLLQEVGHTLALTDEGVLLADSLIRALSLALDEALEREERPQRLSHPRDYKSFPS
ncbi:MAG: radical SAM family heme chaperone HemW [Myxococcota bacterium]